MSRAQLPGLLLALALLATAGSAQAAGLTINLTYDDLKLDPLSSGTFNAQEKAVINRAVQDWQNSITTNLNVNVTLLKSALPGSLLGLASNYASTLGDTDADGLLNGQANSGRIQIDDRVGDVGQFWVDPSPGDNSEFVPGKTPYQWTGGCPGQYDMLSIARHEIGHVLGFTTSYDGFSDGELLLGNPHLRWVYIFGAAPTLGGNQYKAGAPGGFPNGAVYMREWEEIYTGAGPRPSHVDEAPGIPPAWGAGPLAGYFPDDLMNGALMFSERTDISNVDLDILGDALGYAVVPEPATLMLLGLGGIGAVIRWRRRG